MHTSVCMVKRFCWSRVLGIGERLQAERMRLGVSQEDFAARAEVARNTQINYEAGRRAPTAAYLTKIAEMGVDPLFVLTGQRAVTYSGGPLRSESTATVLSVEESALVDNYRAASRDGKRALEATGAAVAKPPRRSNAA